MVDPDRWRPTDLTHNSNSTNKLVVLDPKSTITRVKMNKMYVNEFEDYKTGL